MIIIETKNENEFVAAASHSRTRKSIKKVQNQASEEKNTFSMFCRKPSFHQKYNKFIKSKLPFYLCIIIYIFICLLGNVVTAINLIKHGQLFSKNENDNYTSYIPLPSQMNESQENNSEMEQKKSATEDLLLSFLEFINNGSEHEVRNSYLFKETNQKSYKLQLFILLLIFASLSIISKCFGIISVST